MTDELRSFAALARRRRSSLRVDPELPIDPVLLEQLLTVAATAPNHRRTTPWRFRVITGDGRRGLGEALAGELLADPAFDPVADAPKLVKARSKYLRAPVMVVVGSRAGTDEVATLENRDAVAAAVQTLLLAATAAGLGSLWSTGAAAESTHVARFCRLDPTDAVVGLVYLGWPTAELDDVERPAPEIEYIEQA